MLIDSAAKNYSRTQLIGEHYLAPRRLSVDIITLNLSDIEVFCELSISAPAAVSYQYSV